MNNLGNYLFAFLHAAVATGGDKRPLGEGQP